MRPLTFFATVAFVSVPCFCLAQMDIAERVRPGQPPLVIAFLDHYSGGSESGFPANSLAAIQYAMDAGLEGVAITVRVTKDNQHVLSDQSSLDRTTDIAEVFPNGPPGYTGSKPYELANYTVGEIRQLALSGGQDGGEHGIPTLDEALDLINGQLFVVIEAEDSFRNTLDPLIQSHDAGKLVFYATGKLERDYDFPKATGAAMMGKLFSLQYSGIGTQLDSLAQMVGKFGSAMPLVEISSRQVLPELIQRADELGVRLVVHGGGSDIALKNGNTENWEAVLSGGPKVFFSDYPNAVIDLINR